MLKYWPVCVLSVVFLSAPCFADGCLPGEPCYEKPAAKAPVVEPAPVAPAMEAPSVEPIAAPAETCSGWGNRVSVGAPIWFFQDEGDEVGGGVYFDLYPCCYPVNLRVGAEVNHMNADQASALTAAEWNGRPANLTFVRVPFAVEYDLELGDRAHLFVGGGPDIINTANDVSDTSVGLHLSARALYEFTNHLGLSVEAGYMWGEVETNEGGDLSLDNTFIIPSLSYTF
ncbi:MAG: porin family protein [Bdellovibrionales bacterium]|nr:porin family protein [Bdellovibrionales bacterium]